MSKGLAFTNQYKYIADPNNTDAGIPIQVWTLESPVLLYGSAFKLRQGSALVQVRRDGMVIFEHDISETIILPHEGAFEVSTKHKVSVFVVEASDDAELGGLLYYSLR